MSARAGTHVDAPLHFLGRGRSVDLCLYRGAENGRSVRTGGRGGAENGGSVSWVFMRVYALELGMRPSSPTTITASARFCGRVGKREAACAHLTTAATMYREMDMRFWLDQAARRGSRAKLPSAHRYSSTMACCST